MTSKTELCILCEKYKSDKCILYRHNYTPYYFEILKEFKESFKNILEIGIGFVGLPGSGIMEHMRDKGYQVGASLRIWRDFFVNAEVWGFDMFKDAMLENENRIRTFMTDQTDQENIEYICKNTSFDFILDDGSHKLKDQIQTFHILQPFLKKNGIYIIEDINPEEWTPEITDSFLSEVKLKYSFQECKVYDIRSDSNFNVLDDIFFLFKK